MVVVLLGCGVPRGALEGDAGARDGAVDAEADAGVDAPGVDAPGVDAPGVDAPELDAPIDAPMVDAPVIDAPGMDACEEVACDTGLDGICAAGTYSCASASCDPDREAAPRELCGNGRDDDCDGTDDEGDCIQCEGRERDGRLYLFCTNIARGVIARSTCESYGMRIVAIEDSAENDWIVSQIDDIDGGSLQSWWIGLYDAEDDDDERSDHRWWPDGAPAPTFEAWNGGEPSDTGQDCVRIVDEAGRGWSDRICDTGGDRYRYICEPD